MDLPVMPPLEPMLSRLTRELPTGPQWRYEPKWDGFRAIAYRDGDELQIVSRDRRPFDRYFPELRDPLLSVLPERIVVDGEIVITGHHGLEFDALLLRIHPAASRVRTLAEQSPASFVAFDLPAMDDRDLMKVPFDERRELLERALGAGTVPRSEPRTQIVVTPQTLDPLQARQWFDGFEELGLDGLIAKSGDLLYHPGERAMAKLKHERTADCVVGGYRLSKAGDGVGSLLLGLYDDGGVLHYVGHTSTFKAPERRSLLQELKALQGGPSFVGGRTPGGPSRWAHGQDKSWVALRPDLVCEVAYDHMQKDRFRHGTRFVRWRPDRRPQTCTFEQLPTIARRR